MRFFAEIDSSNYVLQVVAVSDTDANDGCRFCHDLFGGNWLETYVNGTERKQYASIGYTYDVEADQFVAPSPFPSWALDANNDWQSPTPMPTNIPSDKFVNWNESTKTWDLIPLPVK